jgi:16S rRNA (cytidine1402-2'-O)-methyltransferase
MDNAPPSALPAGLHLVATPIGNLRDITLRALDTLRTADRILAEDTRHSRRLLEAHGIRARLESCHQFNEAARTESVLADIAAGRSVALVSDAGTPGVSDPGARLVRACRERDLPVHAVPGPSAVTTAVALSGWGDAGFVFLGFLSHKSAARRRVLAELAQEPRAVVLFESPHRFLKLLDELAEILPNRPVFVARELTKTFEQCVTGTAADLRSRNIPARGEFVVVLAALRRRDLPEVGEDAGAIDSTHPRC